MDSNRDDLVLGKMDAAAISVHELYLSFRRAGFRPSHAVYLTAQYMQAHILAMSNSEG